MIHFEDAQADSRQAFLGRCPRLTVNATPKAFGANTNT